jgi:hypothetical protein
MGALGPFPALTSSRLPRLRRISSVQSSRGNDCEDKTMTKPHPPLDLDCADEAPEADTRDHTVADWMNKENALAAKMRDIEKKKDQLPMPGVLATRAWITAFLSRSR